MKILLICQYYHPEPFRVHDLCEALAKRGHELHVVTGMPNYPEGKFYAGYEHSGGSDEILNGVHVHRCRILPRKTGVINRFLNYYSYVFASMRYVRSRACSPVGGGKFDMVLIYQLSPVMMAEAGLGYKKRNRVPAVMYCLDLWPESLAAGGIRQSSPIYWFFGRISRRLYRNMDRILVTSRMFVPYLHERFGIDSSRIEYLPQYAEAFFAPSESQERKGEPIRLAFAGNIGAAQSIDTILDAAALLRNEAIEFHIAGGGVELERLRHRAEEESLSKVFFYGRKPALEMPEFYAAADAMIVTLQKNPVLSLTLPGKVQSYMAAGKPIIGAIDGETAAVIEEAQCGFCGPAEDAEVLAENIRRFCACEKKNDMVRHAAEYYSEHYDREAFLNRLEKELYAASSWREPCKEGQKV